LWRFLWLGPSTTVAASRATKIATTTGFVRRLPLLPRRPGPSRRLPASGAHLVALATLDTRRPFVSTQPACQLLSHSSAVLWY
jgi:hypothetical protein